MFGCWVVYVTNMAQGALEVDDCKPLAVGSKTISIAELKQFASSPAYVGGDGRC